ncbi:mycothione reductase [Pseudonocardia sp. HH130630-07]|uniref:mycothione reductase n=1 Tax=Pseudonocardia sp. HH130630-07 TaxID=1690815 RepID=UPI0008150B3A|nr:mycothione reductase [Pseudonocardia sp. HH130630-07]ANY09766.1 mycothione reductase [Pseudonocardia sp. HH130630-07]
MTHHDLAVIGTGSGNTIVDHRFAGLDVVHVEATRFGGTCLNVGCIPTKMLAYAAEVAETVRTASRFGIDARIEGVRWPDIRDRVFGRLDPIGDEGRDHRREHGTVHDGYARFTGPRAMAVDLHGGGTAEFTADRIVLATGGRPLVPPPVAESGVPFDTSDTIMRIDELPRHLAVIGGGYIAAELAHVFGGLGCEVTVVEASETLLGGMDETVVERFTAAVRERFTVHTGRSVEKVTGGAGDVRLHLDDGTEIRADRLLVAAGRAANSDRLDTGLGGVATRDDGRIQVDEYGRTTADGVWALGDACTGHPLKHVANHEAAVVAHNLANPDDLRAFDHTAVPAAVFTTPQIGTVGRTEQQCREDGLEYRVGLHDYADVAYGWAMEDRHGFCKVLTAPDGTLLGAHLLGPQASTLVQQLVQAMALGAGAGRLADVQYWIHPALSEVVENALRDAAEG